MMAQPVEVMAFRKRLKKRGYTDISISWDTDQEVYRVRAREPLAEEMVERWMNRWEMVGFMR